MGTLHTSVRESMKHLNYNSPASHDSKILRTQILVVPSQVLILSTDKINQILTKLLTSPQIFICNFILFYCLLLRCVKFVKHSLRNSTSG